MITITRIATKTQLKKILTLLDDTQASRALELDRRTVKSLRKSLGLTNFYRGRPTQHSFTIS